jgi:hypothetical protein
MIPVTLLDVGRTDDALLVDTEVSTEFLLGTVILLILEEKVN